MKSAFSDLDNWPPPPAPTHAGPHARVRARLWTGYLDSTRFFILDGPASLAYWMTGDLPDRCLHVETDHDGVQVAWPGDWLVWTGPRITVVDAADFAADYRPIEKE